MSFFEKFGRSAVELKSIRCITVTGVLIALDLVLKMLTIKLTNDLKITFAFIALATIGMLFGPTVGFLAGIMTDVIGYLLNSDGGFSPLFTLIEAIGGMIYGIFLYDIKPVSVRQKVLENASKNVLGKKVLWSILTGMIGGIVFGAVTFVINRIAVNYTDAEGTTGKVAAVVADPMLIYAAAVVGFLYGLFFAVIISSGSGEKNDIISSVRMIVSKIVVVVICNLLMTPAAMILSGYTTLETAISTYPARVVKNAVQCPVDCLIMLIVLFPILAAYKRIFPKARKIDNEQNSEDKNG